jgi:hypothetical protein
LSEADTPSNKFGVYPNCLWQILHEEFTVAHGTARFMGGIFYLAPNRRKFDENGSPTSSSN